MEPKRPPTSRPAKITVEHHKLIQEAIKPVAHTAYHLGEIEEALRRGTDPTEARSLFRAKEQGLRDADAALKRFWAVVRGDEE